LFSKDYASVVLQVLSITTFISGLMFNLVVSIAMANISTALSVTAWSVVGRRIWFAIFTALICGGITGFVLMLLETPIFDLLMFISPMRKIASPYWLWRCATIPAILVLRVVTGVLGGFQRTAALTCLSFVSSIIEGSLVAIMIFALGFGLDGVGFASCVVNSAFSVLMVLAIPAFTPPESRGRISLWADLPCCVCLCRRKVENARAQSRNQPLLFDMGEPQAPKFAPCTFLRDGSDTIIRYICLQGSLLAVTICASRMGENMLATHHIVVLLWMVTSYIIGKFHIDMRSCRSHILTCIFAYVSCALFFQMGSRTWARSPPAGCLHHATTSR
jgi:Na+-driven multidrug efflux pump